MAKRCNVQIVSTWFGGAFTLDGKMEPWIHQAMVDPPPSPFPPVQYLLFLLSNM